MGSDGVGWNYILELEKNREIKHLARSYFLPQLFVSPQGFNILCLQNLCFLKSPLLFLLCIEIHMHTQTHTLKSYLLIISGVFIYLFRLQLVLYMDILALIIEQIVLGFLQDCTMAIQIKQLTLMSL